MTPRQRQRIAELTAARDHIDRQLRLLTGDRATPAVPVELTPAQIRARAEEVRVRAVLRYRDSDDTITRRRRELLEDMAQWVDYRHNQRTAA